MTQDLRSDSKADAFDRLAVVGKAFGSARRLELVDLLAQREHSVDELAEAAGVGVTSVSAHLQILRLAHLVASRREGRRVLYRLAGDDVLALYHALRSVARDRSPDVAGALAAYLGAPGSDEVGAISRAELEELVGAGEAVLVDVRPAEEFRAGHVPGARSIPFDELEARRDELATIGPARIVAYCRGAWCVLAHDAVRLLGAHGIEATRLEDGMLEWRAEGRPVAVGA